MDEHRVGLKPILRRVWAKRGCRPTVVVRPRYEWLYLYGFVCPETGATQFWMAPGVNREAFRLIAQACVKSRCAEQNRRVLLGLDRAGWHVSQAARALEQEHALELVYLPAYSPELQPAERLWELCDEPVANAVFDQLGDLEAALAERCAHLTDETARIRSRTLYHWWPGGADHSRTI
jgi:hypothetical protein